MATRDASSRAKVLTLVCLPNSARPPNARPRRLLRDRLVIERRGVKPIALVGLLVENDRDARIVGGLVRSRRDHRPGAAGAVAARDHDPVSGLESHWRR